MGLLDANKERLEILRTSKQISPRNAAIIIGQLLEDILEVILIKQLILPHNHMTTEDKIAFRQIARAISSNSHLEPIPRNIWTSALLRRILGTRIFTQFPEDQLIKIEEAEQMLDKSNLNFLTANKLTAEALHTIIQLLN